MKKSKFLNSIYFQNNNIKVNLKSLKNENATFSKIFILSSFNNKHYSSLINSLNELNVNYESYFINEEMPSSKTLEDLKNKIDFKTSLLLGLGDDTIAYFTKKLSNYFEINYALFLSEINSIQCFENFILEKDNGEITITKCKPALRIFIEEDDIKSLPKNAIKSLLKDLISHLDCNYFICSLNNKDLNITKISETLNAYQNILKLKENLFFGEPSAKLVFFDNLIDICDYFNNEECNYINSNNFNFSKSLYFVIHKNNELEKINFYDICATTNIFLFDIFAKFLERKYKHNFELPNLYKTFELCNNYKIQLTLEQQNTFSQATKALNFKINTISDDCIQFLHTLTEIHNNLYNLFKKFNNDGGYKISNLITSKNLTEAFILTPYFCKNNKNILNLLYWIGAFNF